MSEIPTDFLTPTRPELNREKHLKLQSGLLCLSEITTDFLTPTRPELNREKHRKLQSGLLSLSEIPTDFLTRIEPGKAPQASIRASNFVRKCSKIYCRAPIHNLRTSSSSRQ
ncbi:MAG: hypothetical protein SFV17_25150 [Candidatus Obscuribacter sp.]|nr:hypothetical protein [Candidatus Obscuribacter sp.]